MHQERLKGKKKIPRINTISQNMKERNCIVFGKEDFSDKCDPCFSLELLSLKLRLLLMFIRCQQGVQLPFKIGNSALQF